MLNPRREQNQITRNRLKLRVLESVFGEIFGTNVIQKRIGIFEMQFTALCICLNKQRR